MKLCFSTLGCVEKGWREISDLAARYGVEGLEIRGVGGTLDATAVEEFSEKNATKTKEDMANLGIRPIVLGTSCMLHSADLREAAIAEGKAAIAVASRLGIPYIRVFGNNIVGERESCILGVIEGLRSLCSLAKDCGICVLLEVHGDFNTLENLSPVVDAMASEPSFGLIWDVAHTHAPYGNNWAVFYEKMRPYIRHVHIKDKRNTGGLTMIGEGDVPFSAIAERMLGDGFDGYFSLEWERYWHTELLPIENALDAFVRVFREQERGR